MVYINSYDKEFNTLYIYRKEEKIKFSIEVLDNFILDIGFKGTAVGIEILDASKILKVSKDQLENIKNSSISTIIKNQGIVVFIQMEFPKTKIESQIAIPAATMLRK